MTITHDALDLTVHGPSLLVTSGGKKGDLFKLPQASDIADIWWLVTEACTEGEWASRRYPSYWNALFFDGFCPTV